MQEQEENFQPDDIAACRANFETALAALKDGLAPAPAAAQAAAPALPRRRTAAEQPLPKARAFTVLFAITLVYGVEMKAAYPGDC